MVQWTISLLNEQIEKQMGSENRNPMEMRL